MLSSVRHRIPFTVIPSTGISDSVLETALPVDQVLLPILVFINTHPTVPVVLTIVRRLDLGMSADPEDDGSFDVTVVDAQTVPAGGQLEVSIALNLLTNTDTPYVAHLLTMTHSDPDESAIVQLLVSGVYDDTTRTNILNFSRSP